MSSLIAAARESYQCGRIRGSFNDDSSDRRGPALTLINVWARTESRPPGRTDPERLIPGPAAG